MGWEIETKKAGDAVKYRIFSNSVNEYIVKQWMTKDEITKWFFWYRFGKFMRDFMEDSITFPNGWPKKIGGKFYDPKVGKKYLAFTKKAVRDDEFFIKRFSDELKKMGVNLSVSDDKKTLNYGRL